MVKKKLSAQTIAIIILAILLILSICFGGVYAYYSSRSTKITGRILMASLKINLVSEQGSSEKSEIVIANSTNIIPNQALENSPLIIKNTSSVPIYLLLVYELNASKIDSGTAIVDSKTIPVIDIGINYINDDDNSYNVDRFDGEWTEWTDYVYSYEFADGSKKTYRCMISAEVYDRGDEDVQRIEVIPENRLKLYKDMGNEYQSTSISFTFQAFAIGSATIDDELYARYNQELGREPTKLEKCRTIIESIYTAEEYHFFEVLN